MDHGMKAAELFVGGYNCAQSGAVSFCDVTGLDEKTTARMVSAFGGGMGGGMFGGAGGMMGGMGGMMGGMGGSGSSSRQNINTMGR